MPTEPGSTKSPRSAASKSSDRSYMQQAIALAGKAHNPSPNPRVGAVLVRGSHIVGRGWHARAGEPHAEIIALKRAGALAKGATLFVTLEPCRLQGRTPPCVGAIWAARIGRVVIGMPDPSANGGGAAELAQHGIEVAIGVLARECAALNPIWLHSLSADLPWITLKLAQTAQGSLTPTPPARRWISSPTSRRAVQHLRAGHDAVLVGIGTVLADDPRLTVRDLLIPHQPIRVVLDPAGRLPATAALLRESGEVIWVTRAPGRLPGATNLAVPSFDLHQILGTLRQRGIHSILVEGGAITATHFLAAGLVDRLELFVADQPRRVIECLGQRFTGSRSQPSGSDTRYTISFAK